MIQAAIVTVLGTSVARALVFPLAFLLFAIPAGEILVPTLMDWTADFTVDALRWSGVPVYREANHFTIPVGHAGRSSRRAAASATSSHRSWSGTIYAAMAYTSTRRRVLFIAASIVVPIVANWLRAYMIVMIGHLSNNKLAVGVDHLIYGWIFFGVVMLLLFWVGSFWREKTSPAPTGLLRRFPSARASSPAPGRTLFAAALAAALAAGLWVPIQASIDREDRAAVPAVAVIADDNGWASSGNAFADWKPALQRLCRGDAAGVSQGWSGGRPLRRVLSESDEGTGARDVRQSPRAADRVELEADGRGLGQRRVDGPSVCRSIGQKSWGTGFGSRSFVCTGWTVG